MLIRVSSGGGVVRFRFGWLHALVTDDAADVFARLVDVLFGQEVDLWLPLCRGLVNGEDERVVGQLFVVFPLGGRADRLHFLDNIKFGVSLADQQMQPTESGFKRLQRRVGQQLVGRHNGSRNVLAHDGHVPQHFVFQLLGAHFIHRGGVGRVVGLLALVALLRLESCPLLLGLGRQGLSARRHLQVES